MLLRHARVYVDIAVKPFAREEAPEPIEIRCLKCGEPYFADVDLYENWPDLEAQEWDAEQGLAAECPDHLH
jgi:hypothetical protein